MKAEMNQSYICIDSPTAVGFNGMSLETSDRPFFKMLMKANNTLTLKRELVHINKQNKRMGLRTQKPSWSSQGALNPGIGSGLMFSLFSVPNYIVIICWRRS